MGYFYILTGTFYFARFFFAIIFIGDIDMITTILFDLDGTLIDTEKLFRVFWRKACSFHGYEMSDEQALYIRSLGRPFAPRLLKEWFGPDFDYGRIRETRREMMKEYFKTHALEAKAGAAEALSKLSERGLRLAVVTATPVDRAEAELEEVGLRTYFEDIVSAANVERGKPAPDVYLEACRILGVKTEECIAVEDAPNGVKSAYAAGIKVIMIPDQTRPEEELIPLIYKLADSLAELPDAIKE